MYEKKIIDPRNIERLRSLPKSNYDDKQDAMAQAMAGQAVFHPDSPFVSIESRSHSNTKLEIPQKEQCAFDKEKSAEEKLGEAIESEIIAFGKKHGFPAIYVITEQDVLPMTVIGGKVVRGGKLNLFTTSDMRQAERIAKKYNGTIGVYKDPSEYNDSTERRKMDGNDCIKYVIPSSICAPGYESGLAARQKEEQEKCQFCPRRKKAQAKKNLNPIL